MNSRREERRPLGFQKVFMTLVSMKNLRIADDQDWYPPPTLLYDKEDALRASTRSPHRKGQEEDGHE